MTTTNITITTTSIISTTTTTTTIAIDGAPLLMCASVPVVHTQSHIPNMSLCRMVIGCLCPDQ
jgi:hypothetical protein